MFLFDKALYCPITKQLLVNPVVTSDGYTYEFDAIRKWIKTAIDKNSLPVSPMNNISILDTKVLIPNKIVGSIIESTIEIYFTKGEKFSNIDSEIEEYKKTKSYQNDTKKIQEDLKTTTRVRSRLYQTPVPTITNQSHFADGNLVKIDQHEFSDFLIQYICRGYLETQIRHVRNLFYIQNIEYKYVTLASLDKVNGVSLHWDVYFQSLQHPDFFDLENVDQ